MSESEHQKQGVAALGCRFSEKAEHVPIKKRRFMFRSPSPPPVVVSPIPEETGVLTKSEGISDRQVASKSITCENDLGRNADNNISTDVPNSDAKFGQDNDFSGISILAAAAAACSSSVGKEYGYAEHDTVVEKSPVLYTVPEVRIDAKAHSFSKDLLKEELPSSSEMSTGGTLSCISTELARDLASNSAGTCKPREVVGIAMPSDTLQSSEKVSCSKDDDMVGSQKLSSRDERFHWDLNVVMDVWEEEPLNDTDVSQDAMAYDNHDSHGKTTALVPGEPERFCKQASGALKSKQDETVGHFVDQNVRLGEKSIVPNSNSNLDVMKSDGLNEADNTAARTLKLNRGNRDYDPQGSETFNSRIVALSSEAENPSTVRDRSISMGFSEIPLVTTKESCEPSKTSLNRCTRYSEREEDGENAEYNDDVSVRRDAMVGTDEAGGVQEDYDSQYEDGELRESTECGWEEYDAVDREYEHVDYGSDNISTCITNPNDYLDSESGQVEGTKNERRSLASVGGYEDVNEVFKNTAKCVENDRENMKDNRENLGLSALEKMELSRGTEQRESSKYCSDDGRNIKLPPHGDEFVVSKGTETHHEPKMFRRALHSRIEGPLSRDGISRDVRPYRTETRFDSGSTRSFERGRHSYHNQGRGRQSGNWDGPSDYRRGYKRPYSPNNNTTTYRRAKLGDDAVMERDSFGCDDRRDNLSFSHQHLNTRTNAPDKKFTPDRGVGFGRGRPFRYGPPLNDSRDGRGRYNNGPSSNESFQSSLKYRRPLSCRDRSQSPFAGRGQSNLYHPRGKSPSRSRSRSPIVWDSPRDRTGAGRGSRNFIKHRSRSPNFRPDVRMQRPRSPNQQASFGTITRTHSSPTRNRWNSGRKDEMEQFGEFGYKQRTTALERSPGRFRPRGDSPRNRKPDGYFKFSDRISEDGAGRGVRYAVGYDDRRKPNTFIRPARRSYEDDGFSNNNDFRNRDGPRFRGRGGFRGTDRRIGGDMPRRFNGDRQTFPYEKSDKFNNSNSKEFTGRYASMNVANQGPQHDSYEDRRRQYNSYNSTNIVQHSDNESVEERSNHNSNENFQDTTDCGGGGGNARDLVGQDTGAGAAIYEQEEKADNLNSQSTIMQNSENDTKVGSAP